MSEHLMEVLTAPVPEEVAELAPDRALDEGIKEIIEPLFRILIHNDDVTPFEYVIRSLTRNFMLSQELAEHIAETAHFEEVAVVVIRPKSEAEKLIGIARSHARADGFPLTFSMEPDE